MKDRSEENFDEGKRDFLKKAAVTAFSVPTIQSFKIDELHADDVSGNSGGPPPWSGGPGGKPK